MRWPEKSYLFDREHRFVYCPIPKVAMTSIKLWVLAVAGDRDDPEIPYEMLGARLRERAGARTLRRRELRTILRDPTWFRFAFVRSPWSRLVSTYLDKFLPAARQARPVIRDVQLQEARQRKRGIHRWRELVAGKKPPDEARRAADREVDFEHGIAFRQFVQYLATSDPARVNRHWRPQHLFLAGHRFGFIGRFENLARDFESVRAKLGIAIDLPHRNSTGRARAEVDECVADWAPERLRRLDGVPGYRRFYSPDLVELVARIYAEDVARFGYEF